jgi:hypothetical protein
LLAVASGDGQANERRLGDLLRRFIRHSTFDIHCTFCSFPEHHQWNT